jgi:DNA repair protein RecO
MAYTTYTSEALVCGAFNRATADRVYRLFVRDAGMLMAEARGVRKEASRQRFALQDFSRVRISLVHTRHGWRVGSVESLCNYYTAASSRAARASVVRLFALLRRLAGGEGAMPTLYEDVVNSLSILARECETRPHLEAVVKLRLLNALGYIANDPLFSRLLQGDVSRQACALSPEEAALLAVGIDEAIKSSHL